MALTLAPALAEDAPELLALHLGAGRRLTEEFGYGPWSGGMTVSGIVATMRRSVIYAARDEARIAGTFALSKQKPWSIDASFFSAGSRPLYLTSMAVEVGRQRCGVGSYCIAEACRLARDWPADVLRLDAWDADAGAGGFYGKCGFREVGRNVYRGAKLIYFERAV